MRLLLAFMAHEWQIQGRSLRSRFVAAAYLGSALALPLAAVFTAEQSSGRSAAGMLALLVHLALPLLTFIASAAFSIDGITRERDERSLTVLGLAPITNAGYILRRWLALCVPCIALSAIPPLVAMGIASSWAGSDVVAGTFLWPWLLRVLPSAALGCAIGLAFGTFAGGTILAVVEALLVGALILSYGNDLLALTGRKIDGAADWMQVQEAMGASDWLFSRHSLRGIIATDAPVDVLEEFDEAAAQITFLGMLATAALGLSIAYLRRSQPDVRPWRIRPNHPVRGFLGWLNRIRLSALPDPGLTKIDAVAICAFLGLAGAFAAHGLLRFDRYSDIGDERYRVMKSGKPDPTPLALVTTSWSVAGKLERDGAYAGSFEIVLTNDGALPQDRVACALGLHFDLFDLAAENHEVTARQIWDRVEITFVPALPADATLVLRGRIVGQAVQHVFPGEWRGRSFIKIWEPLVGATLPSNLFDLSRATTQRAASPSAIGLSAEDLAPVPRYETWQLQTFGEGYGSWVTVPTDDVAPITEAALDIEVAEGVFLADTCGHVAVEDANGRRRLSGTCRTLLASLTLRGGRLVGTPGTPESIAAVAVLPGHVEAMQLHLPQIASAGEAAATAWPGIAVPPAVVVELPSGAQYDGYDISIGGSRSDGSILLIDERRVLARVPLETVDLATAAVATALLAQRPTPTGEARFFRRFYRELAASRLGTGSDRAVMDAEGGARADRYALGLLSAKSWQLIAWEERLPALVRALRARVGDERLAEGVNAFLAGSGAGSAKELFSMIELETSVSLAQFYEDFVAGSAVPVLTLEDVTFTQVASGWQVAGFVHNTRDGHVTCPVVVRTDAAPVAISVAVGPEDRTAFHLETRDRPRLVLLDPLGDCFRYRPKNGIGIVERVEHGGRN